MSDSTEKTVVETPNVMEDRPIEGNGSAVAMDDKCNSTNPTKSKIQTRSQAQLQSQHGNQMATGKNKKRKKGFSCPICENKDTDEMVQCDSCNIWYHHRCVGVTEEEVRQIDWVCPSCTRHNDEINENESGANSQTVTHTHSSRRVVEKLAALEELAQIEIEEAKRLAEIKKNLVEQRLELLSCTGSMVSSKCGSISSSKKSKSGNKVMSQQGEREDSPMDPNFLANVKNRSTQSVRPETKRTTFNLEHPSYVTPLNAKKDETTHNNNYFDEVNVILSAPQVMARQALEKIDLPSFDDAIGDWPKFITSYNLSTARCGYSNVENMIRLKNSLKGKALKAVQGRLFYPSQVPGVIEKLQELYGRPDKILNGLIKIVRDLPEIQEKDMDALIEMSQEVDNLCGTIEATHLQEHHYNTALQQKLVEKLPGHLRLSWSIYCDTLPEANLMTFRDWLNRMSKFAIRVTDVDENKTTYRPFVKTTQSKQQKNNVGAHDGEIVKTATAAVCKICDEASHSTIEKCQAFKNMNATDRWKVIIKYRLCGRCLGNHYFKTCKHSKKCDIDDCGRNHHRMLHNPKIFRDSQLTDNSVPSTSKNIGVSSHHTSKQNVLLRIIPVKLYGKKKSINTFALLDDGSTVSLVEEKIAAELQLEGPVSELCLTWTGNMTRTEHESKSVNLEISAIGSNSERYRMSDVYTVAELGLPNQTLSIESTVEANRHLKGLPIPSYVNGRPTILIGQKHFQLGIPLVIHQGAWDEPVAAKTRLGWSIYGYGGSSNDIFVHFHKCGCNGQDMLHELVKRYMTLDSFGVGPGKEPESEANKRAMSILSSTIKENGRYTASLLWKNDEVVLPESKEMALRRLICFERKLNKNPQIDKVQQIICEYISKGYIRKLTNDEALENGKVWYLPVFLVSNPNKPEKVRLVWDFAAKSNGMCLNDALIAGPDMLTQLPHVLYKFREGRYAVTADVMEMFHQINIRPEDQNSQRMLWRNCDSTEEPSICVMTVMSFGANCSPTTAQYVKNHNAEEFKNQYPRAVRAIISNHYVDD